MPDSRLNEDVAGRLEEIARLLAAQGANPYREKAAAGRLVKIAPRRFNPSRVAWLPILHTERGPRHYSALFSNTAALKETADRAS